MRTKWKAIYSVRINRLFERIYVHSDGKEIFTAWPPTKRLNEIRRRLNDPQPVVILRPVISDESDE